MQEFYFLFFCWFTLVLVVAEFTRIVAETFVEMPPVATASLLYVMATTAYGMMISSFTSTQIAAIFGTIILTILPASMFAGMTTPASAITGFGRILGALFPMTYYLPVSVGAFTKGLGVVDLFGHVMILALFAPAFIAISWMLLRKQEK